MKRREFLARSSMFTVAGLFGRSIGLAQTSAPSPARMAPATPTEFKLLRRDVGYFTGRGGTIGWLAAKDGLAAVDTQFPDSAAIFLRDLPGRGGRKLDVVINTHHHGDHTGGNGTFRPECKALVAHAAVPALQRAAAERAEKNASAQPASRLAAQVYADTTFAETWRMELGTEALSARFHGPAHTGGDSAIVFEQANVVHLGDLVFNRMYPVTDRPGGGSVRGWVRALEDAARIYPADAIFVFGHGNPKFGVTGARADLLVMRDYLSAILDYVQKKISAGEPREKIVALENLPGFEDFHAPAPNRLGGNLGAVYDELTAKGA
jgi:glyoxylase-like metal-dependent hydrolase (beta-lactamase superfamily II)